MYVHEHIIVIRDVGVRQYYREYKVQLLFIALISTRVLRDALYISVIQVLLNLVCANITKDCVNSSVHYEVILFTFPY